MTLRDFLETFVRENSLIRLWTTEPEKHTMIVGPNGEEVGMDWSIKDGTGWQSRLADREVLYISDILCENYREAINIVIKPSNNAMTNGDRLRSISDEELAVFLDETQRKECESLHLVENDGTLKFESCVPGWLYWLRQPAEEE